MELLPDNLLHLIFEHLKGTDLKYSCLVCKKWNEVIGQSSKLMEKLQLLLNLKDYSWSQIYWQTQNINRRIVKIRIKNCFRGWSNNTCRALPHISGVKALVLTNCTLKDYRDAETFGDLLSSLRQLTSLRVTFFQSHVGRFAPYNLPTVKKIHMFRSTESLRFFQTAQLTSLTISDYFCSNHFDLLGYLASQNNIEELVLEKMRSTRDKHHINVELLKTLRFPLKRLRIDDIIEWLQSNENIATFVNNFSDSLELLELGRDIPESVYEMIFMFPNLKTVDIKYAPRDSLFCRNLPQNETIRTLVIHGCIVDDFHEAIEGLVGKLPNLETLILSINVTQELMIYISNNLRNLRSLELKYLSGIFDGVNIPSLTSIAFQQLLPDYSLREFESIVRAFPNIESFSVNRIDDQNSEVELNNFVRGWSNLKRVSIGQRN